MEEKLTGRHTHALSATKSAFSRETAKGERVIFHIDINSFFATVEEIFNPQLKNKPFVVGGRTRRSVVGSANYLARKLGAKAGMPIFQVEQLSREIVVVDHHFDRYERYSEMFMDEVQRVFTPQMEPASIDECFADVTDHLDGQTPEAFAERLQRHILKRLNMGVSIGISVNKPLAKIASDMKKPLGITRLWPEDVPTLLWPMPIKNMLWVGPSTGIALNLLGIYTIGDLANYKDIWTLREKLGVVADALVDEANGRGSDVVEAGKADGKSIGHSVTLPEDSVSYEEVAAVVREICEAIELRALRARQVGSRIAVVLRDASFNDKIKNATLANPTQDASLLLAASLRLLDKMWTDGAIRLVGVSLGGLTHADAVYERKTIFNFDEASGPPVSKQVIDSVNARMKDKVLWTGEEFERIKGKKSRLA